MSLSGWLRDYVYIPLGGSRKGEAKTYRNIICTMFLSGMWHGAGWNYIVWGMIHAIAQCIHRLWRKLKLPWKAKEGKQAGSNGMKVLAICLNFLFICFTWMIFRVQAFDDIWIIIKGIACWQEGIMYIYVWTIPYFILIMGAQAYAFLKNSGHGLYIVRDLNKFHNQVLFWLILFLTIGLAYMGNMAFIYNKF